MRAAYRACETGRTAAAGWAQRASTEGAKPAGWGYSEPMSARSVVVAATLSLAVLSVAGTASASDPAPWPTQGFGWQGQGGVSIGLGGVPVWTAGLDEARDGLSVAVGERAAQRGELAGSCGYLRRGVLFRRPGAGPGTGPARRPAHARLVADGHRAPLPARRRQHRVTAAEPDPSSGSGRRRAPRNDPDRPTSSGRGTRAATPRERRGRMTVRTPPRVTEDAALLGRRDGSFVHTDPWRVLRIMGEFVDGFDALAEIAAAVAVFGSARTRRSDRQYAGRAARRPRSSPRPASPSSPAAGRASWRPPTAARGGRRALDRLQHRAAVRAGDQPLRRPRRELPLLLRAQDDVREVLGGVRHLPRRVRHARRAVRGADADPDQEDPALPGDPLSAPSTGRGCSTGCASDARREQDQAARTSTSSSSATSRSRSSSTSRRRSGTRRGTWPGRSDRTRSSAQTGSGSSGTQLLVSVSQNASPAQGPNRRNRRSISSSDMGRPASFA